MRALSVAEQQERGPDSAWRNCTHQLPKVTSCPVLKDRESGWDYAAFYKAAERAGCGHLDLFQVRGQGATLYLPASNYLFILPGDV